MQINKVSLFNYNTSGVSFGTTAREYIDPQTTYVMNQDSWMGRSDLNWKDFVKLLDKTFKQKDKVNVHSLACSDASEIYTLMLYLEYYSQNKDKYYPFTAADKDSYIIEYVKKHLITISDSDWSRIPTISKSFFKKNQRPIKLENDSASYFYPQYFISPNLTKNVKFKTAELMDELKNIKDSGNSVILCRNVFYYLKSNNKVRETAEIAGKKLKQGSLFIIGDYDRKTKISEYLEKNGFKQIMHNVYQKVS